MRLSTRLLSATALSICAASTLVAHADSVLVGAAASGTGSSGLCPNSAGCSLLAEQFTLFAPVVIDQIKVDVDGPARLGFSDGNFSVQLGAQLGSGVAIGSGDLVFDPNQTTPTTEVFDFNNLNIVLGPGTYYLELTGGNVGWLVGQPIDTSVGIAGPTWLCDPTISDCSGSSRWQPTANSNAFEIDGTVAPEPSTFVLLGTGILGLAGAARRKFSRT
jgi:hypothetical protein